MPVYGCVILGFALAGGALARWLSSGVVVFLGNASYSMYILHMPIYAWMNIICRRVLLLEPTGLWWQIAYLSTVILLSSLVYKGVEEPLNLLLKSKLNLALDRQ